MADTGGGGEMEGVDALRSFPATPATTTQQPQTQQPTPNQPNKIVKRRNRIPVSCEPCRTRRSKCDRGNPCGQCEKREEAQKCVYVKAADKTAKSASAGRHSESLSVQKLNALEDMIFEMAQREQQTDDASTQAPRPGQSEYAYVNASEADQQSTPALPATQLAPHWTSILHSLRDLRVVLDRDDEDAEGGVLGAQEKPVILGMQSVTSLTAVLQASLPDKQEIDRLIDQYFQATAMVLPIIHRGQFSYQAEHFLSPQTPADPAWFAILFGILALSNLVAEAEGQETDVTARDRYTTAAAQCINIAGYTHPRRHIIPALLLLVQVLYAKTYDPSYEVALLSSMICRLAYKSGLHHEPPADTSPFEGEIRRRLWVMVKHFDVQIACQLGVPSSIQYNSFDTAQPLNLLDTDLQGDIASLPPSRSDSERTIMSPFIIKSNLMNIFLEVYHHAQAVTEPPTDVVMELDHKVRLAHANTPDRYKPHPISQQSANVSDHDILSSLGIEFLALKTLCILHRRRMVAGEEKSKTACMEAAVRMVTLLTDLVPHLDVGGALQGRYYLLTSTVINDFLLGVMIICMNVSVEERFQDSKSSKASRDEQLYVLEKARNLCLQLSGKSRGIRRVLGALDALMAKVGRDIMAGFPTSEQAANAILALNAALGQGQLTMQPQTQQLPTPASMSTSSYPVPSPGPSLALSHERSTTNGGYGPAEPALEYQQGPQYHSQFHAPMQQQLVDPFEHILGGAGGDVGAVNWAAFDHFIHAPGQQGWNEGMASI